MLWLAHEPTAVCQRENCDKKHNTLLHLPTTNCDKRPATEELVKSRYVGSNIHKVSDVLLPVLPIKVRANNDQKTVETFAILDPGSTASFCTESLLSKLKVTICNVQLMTTTISSQNQSTKAKLVQNLKVWDMDENECTV